MNNDLMLVSRELLQAVATGDFREQGIALASLRRMLAESPAARAVDEDSERRKQAFGKWYAANPYEELTNATVAWMAYHEGARMERAALAAPAQSEQEPVAWQNPENDSSMCTAEHKAYALSNGGAPATALGKLTRPLYAAPVQAVRLPERRPYDGHAPSAENIKAGAWNAALDAVAQLNQSPNQKEITE